MRPLLHLGPNAITNRTFITLESKCYYRWDLYYTFVQLFHLCVLRRTVLVTVRATTRMGYIMTSPKFSTWGPNQRTRSRATFNLFYTPRNDLSPQYLRSCAFECWGSTWVWKKWQPMKFECSLEVKRLKTGVFQLKDLPDRAQNNWG